MMNNFIALLYVFVFALFIVEINILHELYTIRNSLNKLDLLDHEVLNLKSVAISHTRQIGELRISIGKLQGNYSDSAEKSQS